ncbi:unnamed protein product [Didymodactylos carnosus]|uniref:NAD(P)(+)--arginine ADP-ribosyltransferase n=1 Tax=Didymodactylos carnosus TaxID=1234261 RepID=A0A814FUX0_9BILA|nr:unnamed protein product [Didymodactylos carnosus]CAF0985269.1 unnamed protein product [Didymodactylos carnosus]CAF3569426.1 unnamed protein product [Didymodactylos carnosus]CAF3757528.1 unnamed protein product [Didymodactylos carnosus]
MHALRKLWSESYSTLNDDMEYIAQRAAKLKTVSQIEKYIKAVVQQAIVKTSVKLVTGKHATIGMCVKYTSFLILFPLFENKDAQWLAEQLRSVKDKGEDEIYKLAISLYTYECFLYKLINKTLGEDDYSKIQTLAPFCSLLHTSNCVAATKSYIYKGIYRGMHLDQEQIEYFKQAIKNGDKQWLVFSSTSQSQDMAENFENTLFIIDIVREYNDMDISELSFFPSEQEVFISASTKFKVENVDYDVNKNKYFIYLTI